jgi:hypothetical protein
MLERCGSILLCDQVASMALIPILLLVVGSGVLWLLRGQKTRVLWSWTTGMTLLVWGTVLALRLALPGVTRLSVWQPEALFASTLELQLDTISWAFIMAGITLVLSTVLAAPALIGGVTESARAFILTYAAMTIAAMLAGNLLTVVMLWSLIDLVALFFILQIGRGLQWLSGLTTRLTLDVISILLVACAALVTGEQQSPPMYEIDVQTAIAATLLCFAVLLRLGLVPLQFSTIHAEGLRRGVGTLMRFFPPAMALLVLARLLEGGVPGAVIPWLQVAGMIGVILGGLRWALEADEATTRYFFILTLSGVGVLAASLSEDNGDLTLTATAALLVLVGGLISLADFYSPAHRVWFILGGAFLTGLPMTPGYAIAKAIAEGFMGTGPIAYALLAGIGMVLLAAGMFRRAFVPYRDWPTGEGLARMAYGISLTLPVLVGIGLGIHLSPRFQISTMWVVLPVLLIAALTALGLRRFPGKILDRWSRLVSWLDPAPVYRLIGWVYRGSMRWVRGVRSILEGEGAMLWLLVVILALAVFFRR